MSLETAGTTRSRTRSTLSRPRLPRFREIFSAALSAVSLGCTVDFVPSGRYLEISDGGGRRNGGVAGVEDANGGHQFDAGKGKTDGGSRDAQDARGADAHSADAHPEDRDGSTGTVDASGPFDAGERDAGEIDAGVRPDAGGRPDAGDLRPPCERGVISCNDGNACTVGERCAPLVEGSDENGCLAGISVEINDGIPCTSDDCNPGTGEISHTPINGDCPAVICKTVVCDPREGCIYTNVADSTPCDIQVGKDEVCFEGTCVPACDDNGDCNDFASCTIDTCNLAAGHCEFTPDDELCSDGRFCTGTEECEPFHEDAEPETGCIPAQRVPVCPDDGKTCTQELCDVEQDRCVTAPLNERCDDQDPCTGVEVCDPETGAADTGCTNPPDTNCSDLNTQCRVGACNSESGLCEQIARPNGTPCNDDLFCNIGEVCQGGDCRIGEARNCSDGNLCTTDSCDEGTDLCVNTPVGCSELNTQCTDGICNPETGNCQAQNKLNGTDCNDGRYCTTPDDCQNGICQSGLDRGCADAIACTIDTCSNELNHCIHTPDNSRCADEDLCSVDVCDLEAGNCTNNPRECLTDETCKVGICLPETGECGVVNVPDNTLCNDGIDCTINDRCQTGTCIGQNPPEIARNRIDDDCDGWIDESTGFDVLCNDRIASITPPGGPVYNCVGGELVEIPSVPRGSNTTNVNARPGGLSEGGIGGRVTALIPNGTSFSERIAYVNGGGTGLRELPCPMPSPPDKRCMIMEWPSAGTARLSDILNLNLTP